MMDIPYTSDVRPDTGTTNQRLGMWLFLASEVMLFGSLFSSYALLRAGSLSWPDQSSVVNVPLASINTVVLLASSGTMMRAVSRLRASDVHGFRAALGLTTLLAIVFLAIKSVEYGGELGHGLRPSTNNFVGLYFVMTFLHAVHVAGGALVTGYLAVRGAVLAQDDHGRLRGRLGTVALYWYFVDIVWILMFVTLYVI
jgi:heme/copper-type cytochrome/quinol oxidase subunit 3